MYRVFVNDETVPVDEYQDVVNVLIENDIRYVERPRLIGSLFRFGSTGAGCDIIPAFAIPERNLPPAKQTIGGERYLAGYLPSR